MVKGSDADNASPPQEVTEARPDADPSSGLVESSTKAILRELQRHQTELETRNEELHRVRRALEASRDRYRDLYEFAPVGYLILDDIGRIAEANLTAVTLLGLERTMLLQRSFESFLSAEGRELWHRQFLARMQQESRAACDLALTRGDGSVFHARVGGARLASGSETAAVTGITLADITERVLAEQVLARRKALLRAIINSALEAIITVDEGQHVVLFNPAAETIFGYSSQEAIGAALDRFIPQRYRAVHAEHLKHFGESGDLSRRVSSPRRVVTGLRRNGEEFPIEVSIAQTTERGAKFYTVVLRDITEQVNTKSKLQRLQAELREFAVVAQSLREREKSRFARELHDELGQALTALKMDATWIMERLAAGQESLAEKLTKMVSMLDDTMAATRRIATNLRPLILDDLGLIPAIEWLVENFREHSGIDCQLMIADPCLDLSERYATAVFRILQESLTNVSKHAHASLVEISLSRVDGEVRLTVRDNGCGFVSTDPRKPDAYGLMGLHERAHLLGGEIRIDSAPDRGTVINLTIPITRSEVEFHDYSV